MKIRERESEAVTKRRFGAAPCSKQSRRQTHGRLAEGEDELHPTPLTNVLYPESQICQIRERFGATGMVWILSIQGQVGGFRVGSPSLRAAGWLGPPVQSAARARTLHLSPSKLLPLANKEQRRCLRNLGECERASEVPISVTLPLPPICPSRFPVLRCACEPAPDSHILCRISCLLGMCEQFAPSELSLLGTTLCRSVRIPSFLSTFQYFLFVFPNCSSS